MSAVTVIKVGGAALDASLDAVWQHIIRGRSKEDIVLVHGGGPQSTKLARRLDHQPRIIRGRRVTDDVDLEIVKMALGGTLNVDLVASALAAGLPAVGITGASGRTIQVVRRPPWEMEEETVDFGHVGDVVGVDTRTLEALLEANLFPVVACMGVDESGAIYNVNADTVAAELAVAFRARRLELLTDSGGIKNPSGTIIATMTASEAVSGVSDGWIRDGMIVKVQTAIEALRRGVGEVFITGTDRVEFLTEGTMIIEDNHA